MIKIIKEPDVHLTEAELARYRDEYRRAYQFYSGTPLPFESWVRLRLHEDRARRDLRENSVDALVSILAATS